MRVPPDKPIRLAWRDTSGRIRCLPGRCIDMSRQRIHIEVREEIPLHTRVMLRAGAISVPNATSVTYVTHYGPTFILVLEIKEQPPVAKEGRHGDNKTRGPRVSTPTN